MNEWVCEKDFKAKICKSPHSCADAISKEETNYDSGWKEPGDEAFKLEKTFL